MMDNAVFLSMLFVFLSSQPTVIQKARDFKYNLVCMLLGFWKEHLKSHAFSMNGQYLLI